MLAYRARTKWTLHQIPSLKLSSHPPTPHSRLLPDSLHLLSPSTYLSSSFYLRYPNSKLFGAMKSLGLMVKGSAPFVLHRPVLFQRKLQNPQHRPFTIAASFRPETASMPSSPLITTPELIVDSSIGGSSAGVIALEEHVEKAIYGCRFLTIFGVAGSLLGSIVCFLKGSVYVMNSFIDYMSNGGKMVMILIEAIDVYLIGTVMLVFGMGLYELFISNLDLGKSSSNGSNLFGLFKLVGRPEWLEIESVDALKTKLGHVIVTVLLVGLVDKIKKVTISSATDLLCFAASILVSSASLYLLSQLHTSKRRENDLKVAVTGSEEAM